MSDPEHPDKPCTLTLPDGTHFDLNPLSSAKNDYQANAGNNDTVYKLNVCRSVVSELWNIDDPGQVGGFVKREGSEHHGDFSLGKVNTNLTLAPTTQEPMMFLANGSKCPRNENELASTAIKTEFGPGQPRLLAALPPGKDACHFFFEWPTHVACPTNRKHELEGQHVWTFVGILTVALVSWFAGQTLYNRLKLGRRGMDQFPIPRFHKPSVQLPSFRGQGEEGAPRPRWGVFKRRSQRNGYNHLRQDPDEEDRLAAARFSLDEDEENDVGAEVNAWRTPDVSGRASDDSQGAQRPSGSVGVHQGLVDL